MIWFTADLHFGHANIIKYARRPFANADEMDEALIANWNSVVNDFGDMVYMVGDLSFRKPAVTESILNRLHGRIGWLLGNHDKQVSAAMRERCEWVEPGLHTVKVPDPDARDGPQRIVLCHYALRVWDQSHRGAWHLYGHSHGTLPDDQSALSMDVGVDATGLGYRPISYPEVKQRMSEKQFLPADHHGADR